MRAARAAYRRRGGHRAGRVRRRCYPLVFAADKHALHLFQGGRAWRFQRHDPRRRRDTGDADGMLQAPLTARIVAVHVAEGDRVQAGQPLVVLEAMKMEHIIAAPFAGVVAELSAVRAGKPAPARCWPVWKRMLPNRRTHDRYRQDRTHRRRLGFLGRLRDRHAATARRAWHAIPGLRLPGRDHDVDPCARPRQDPALGYATDFVHAAMRRTLARSCAAASASLRTPAASTRKRAAMHCSRWLRSRACRRALRW